MEKLKLLFSLLVVHRHNIHVLHWKAKGIDFDGKHKLADDYVSKFSSFIDEIAEIMLMLGMNPLGLEECVNTIKDSEEGFSYFSGKVDFSNEELVKHINDIFDQLLKKYEEVYDDVPSDIQSKLDEHIYWLRLESKYKGSRRVM